MHLYERSALTPSASSTCEVTSCPRLLSGPNFSPRPYTGSPEASARAADDGQAREAAEVFVGDRHQELPFVVQQTKPERLAGELESCGAGSERPHALIRLRDFAALRAGDDQSVVGFGARAHADPEYARAEGGDAEHVAGAGRELGARRRCAETVRRGEAEVRGGVELHR